jgi:branched-chain amino acid aminotransferase
LGTASSHPPLTSGPLAGITRELIMEWSPVEERELTLEEAQQADEVFLTSSMRNIQASSVGMITRTAPCGRLPKHWPPSFAKRAQDDLDP